MIVELILVELAAVGYIAYAWSETERLSTERARERRAAREADNLLTRTGQSGANVRVV